MPAPQRPIPPARPESVRLGDRVKDKISGVTGIVTGVSEFLYGCRRISVHPEKHKDGKPADSLWIDEPQATVIKRGAVKGFQAETAPAGPREDAVRRDDARR